MKKWTLMVCLTALVLGLGAGMLFSVPGDGPVSPEPRATTTQADLQAFYSEGYLSGGTCYISCRDGSFTTVSSFSTEGCCRACAEFCNDLCVGSGDGLSVICDGA